MSKTCRGVPAFELRVSDDGVVGHDGIVLIHFVGPKQPHGIETHATDAPHDCVERLNL